MSTRLGLALLLTVTLAGCTLPRGAAMQGEILSESQAESPTFDIVQVTRAELAEINKWSATGAQSRYSWLQASRGPASAVLKPGDEIDLVIWDSQEVSLLAAEGERSTTMSGLPVSAEGTIFVPYVGEVTVSGMTQTQARKEIQDQLSRIAPTAQVQLSASAGGDNTVDLVSGVASPGRVALSGRNVTILSVIAESGGISTNLNNPLVRLIRDGRTYQIRADDLFSDASRNITVRGGDKIVVEEDKRYFVGFGATGSEELITFDRERITAIEALSMLGGLTDNRANPKGVLILREYPASAVKPRVTHGPDLPDVIFTFDLTKADGLFAARNFRVFPGDTVIATESPLGTATSVLGVVGSLLSLSDYL